MLVCVVLKNIAYSCEVREETNKMQQLDVY